MAIPRFGEREKNTTVKSTLRDHDVIFFRRHKEKAG